MRIFAPFVVVLLIGAWSPAEGQSDTAAAIDRSTQEVLPQVVTWRRDFHQHPELGMQEVRTSKIIADHLRGLGMEVQTGVAGTGVVGILEGGKPGKVVGLRADMDALPVVEQVDVPFKSTQKAMWDGQETGVMHACGHDNHMAMLMGVATVLSRMRAELPGTVKFIFQPAEEGPGGAEPMVRPACWRTQSGRRVRTARRPVHLRDDCLPFRSADGECRRVPHRDYRQADARRHAVERRGSHREDSETESGDRLMW